MTEPAIPTHVTEHYAKAHAEWTAQNEAKWAALEQAPAGTEVTFDNEPVDPAEFARTAPTRTEAAHQAIHHPGLRADDRPNHRHQPSTDYGHEW